MTSQRALHLYIHVPFCTRRCSYCDFAIAIRKEIPAERFVDAILLEAERRAGEIGTSLTTVYLGGGTPSRLPPAAIARLAGAFPTAVDGEVTVEANPEDVTEASASAWRESGVTRVSLGAQSFDDRVLAWMHRSHDAARIRAAAETLRRVGLTNWSLDLIFALPDHLERDWRGDLDAALALDPSHISLYGLTVEEKTPLGRWRDAGLVVPTTETRYAEEFLMAHETLVVAGFDHYEVSNFSRPGFHSQHNSAYWTPASYVGLGPSAHSFDSHRRRWNIREYTPWLRAIDAGESALAGEESLSDSARALEAAYLGLRTQSGARLPANARGQVLEWTRRGWAVTDDGVTRLTAEGWLRLDALVASLPDSAGPK